MASNGEAASPIVVSMFTDCFFLAKSSSARGPWERPNPVDAETGARRGGEVQDVVSTTPYFNCREPSKVKNPIDADTPIPLDILPRT